MTYNIISTEDYASSQELELMKRGKNKQRRIWWLGGKKQWKK